MIAGGVFCFAPLWVPTYCGLCIKHGIWIDRSCMECALYFFFVISVTDKCAVCQDRHGNGTFLTRVNIAAPERVVHGDPSRSICSEAVIPRMFMLGPQSYHWSDAFSGKGEGRTEVVNARGQTTPVLSVLFHSTPRLSQGSEWLGDSGARDEAPWFGTDRLCRGDMFTRSANSTRCNGQGLSLISCLCLNNSKYLTAELCSTCFGIGYPRQC
jgi:hypothetical protein